MREDVNLSARDSRVDVKDEKIVRIINEGPSQSTYQAYPATNQSSTTSTIFQINPPSSRVGLCRYVRLRIIGQMAFTGTNLQACSYALRAWPLASIMTSCQLQINNANVAYSQQNQFMPAFGRVANPVINQNTYQSGTATAPDQFNQYNDYDNTVSSPFMSGVDISAGEYVQHGRTEQITGIYQTAPAQQGGVTQLVVSFDISEPLLVAPFCADSTNIEALYNISQLNVAINWGTQHKMFSVNCPAGSTITNATPTFTTQSLLINYVTPHEHSLTMQMPNQVYNCPNIQLYTSAFNGTVNAPISANWDVVKNQINPASYISQASQTSTITLPRCPRLAILWVTDAQGTNLTPYNACTVPDRFYPIQSASVNCYDRSSLLSGATPQQLYEMSVAAGLNATQAQFMGTSAYTGTAAGRQFLQGSSMALPDAIYNAAPLVIDFTNLSLPPGIAPGVDIQTQLQINFTFANNLLQTNSQGSTSQALAGYQVNLLLVTDGYLICGTNGSAEWIVGGLSTADVRHAHESSDSQFKSIVHQQTRTTLIGGNFWDTLKDVGRSVLSVAAPIVSAVAPELAPVVGIASKLAGAGRMSKAHAKRAAYY